ncbi:membrane protease YdiL (CAAX protease family) [Alkalibacillus almallahensis]|nr:membrane protease YdiL (CAAX protease family) [Alkalibacillus almallahensis]
MSQYTAIQFILYLVTVVGLSLIFTWVYNGSGGVILLPILAHATANLSSFTTTS